jgi:hypothetical protein
MRRTCLIALCGSLLLGCTPGSPGPPGPGPGPADPGGDAPSSDPDLGSAPDLAPLSDLPQGNGRFVGLWLVDQPTHALYELTFYELRADGVLRTGRADPPGCTGHLRKHCVTGSVASADMARSCVFSDRWSAPDERTLVIRGRCSDGKDRDIALDFTSPPARDGTSGADVEVKTVGGETGWVHDNWPWRFLRCAPGETEITCR